MTEVRERSLSVASTDSAVSSTNSSPHLIGSQAPELATRNKLKSIAAIFFAAVSVTLIVLGTVAGLGLPAIIAGAAAGILSLVSLYLARKKEELLEDLEPPMEQVYPKRLVGDKIVEECDDLCVFIDEGTNDANRIYPVINGLEIHPSFIKDCTRNRADLYINGESFASKFKEESEEVIRLHNEDLDYEVQKEELQNKIIDDFTGKLEGKKAFSKPISAAFCQNIGILLNGKILEMTHRNYSGELMPRLTDPKQHHAYYLDFPEGLAARIRVKGSGEFSCLIDGKVVKELNPPCVYDGKATIEIGLDGKSKIEMQASLLPKY